MAGFSGAVLAGGRSSRFGQDKASYVYRGQPLAAWVLASLAEASERFIVAGRPYDFGVPVHPDLHPGSSLGGVHAALAHAQHGWVALAACDLPHLTPAYWQRLLAHVDSDQAQGAQAVVVAGPAGRLEPLAGLYHRSLLPLAQARLEAGDLRLHAFVTSAGARVLPREVLGVDEATLLNANRLRDLL